MAAGAMSLVLLAGHSPGQTATNTPAASAPEATTNQWAFYASATAYLVPHSRDYVNPMLTADRDWLHLEARYNYEALDTGSTWLGYNLRAGSKLALNFTPMLGGVFGHRTGVAPGYNLLLSYGRFTLSSQGEYFFDTGDRPESFFYTWSEFSYSPWEWLRGGIVIQRTRAYQTDFDIQRGLLVGFSYKKVDFTTYVLNPGWADPVVQLTVGVQF